MIWRTTAEQEAYLPGQPESGMGYQIIEFSEPGGRTPRLAVAFQAVLIVELDEAFEMELSYLSNRSDWDAWVTEPDSFGILRGAIQFKLHRHSANSTFDLVAEPALGRCGRRVGGGNAVNQPELKADGRTAFVRVSAFSNDRRVDINKKCVLPGTFATTLHDYLACVTCPDDPVDRYALPSPLAITTAFFIRPSGPDILQKGIVQPNFGHAGGGEEVFFVHGTTSGTLIDIRPYGDEAHH